MRGRFALLGRTAIGLSLVASASTGCNVGIDIGTLPDDGTSGSGAGSASGPLNGPLEAPMSTTCSLQTIPLGMSPGRVLWQGDSVYVTGWNDVDTRFIKRMPLSGAAPTTLVSEPGGDGYFPGFAVDGSFVYWADWLGDGTSNVKRVSVAGGSPEVVIPASEGSSGRIAVDGSYLYAAIYLGGIGRVPIGGGSLEVIVAPTAEDVSIDTLVVDATHIYWSEEGLGPPSSRLYSAPIEGGERTELIAYTGWSGALQVTPDALLIANSGTIAMWPESGPPHGNGGVIRVPFDPATSPATIAWDQAETQGVAEDASGRFWGGGIEWSTGDLHGAPVQRMLPNGKIETVANAVLGGMSVCDGAICWTNSIDDTLVRATCTVPTDPTPLDPTTIACNDFCGAIGGCSPYYCHETCGAMLAAPCAQEGAALTACLATHFDPLDCKAAGCDAESAAYASCRGGSVSVCDVMGSGGTMSANGKETCSSVYSCSIGDERAICDTFGGVTNCTCYFDLTPVGTCTPTPAQMTMEFFGGCSIPDGCCHGSIGAVL